MYLMLQPWTLRSRSSALGKDDFAIYLTMRRSDHVFRYRRGEDVTEEILLDAEAVASQFGTPSRRHRLCTGTVASVNFGQGERKRA
jgi:hypothetical protein